MVHTLRHGFDSHHLHHICKTFNSMEPAHFDNIHTQIKDSFADKKENRNLILNSKFQLLLTQLDLFKVL